MVTLEILIILENILSLLLVYMEFKVITKSMEYGFGEEPKFQNNGKSIKAMIISNLQN